MKLRQKLDYRWFNRNRKKIVTGHEGEFVLISGKRMWGYYKDSRDGIKDAVARGFSLGCFIVQQCFEKEPVYYI